MRKLLWFNFVKARAINDEAELLLKQVRPLAAVGRLLGCLWRAQEGLPPY